MNHHTTPLALITSCVCNWRKRNANAVMPSWECSLLPDLAPSATFSILCALNAIYIRNRTRRLRLKQVYTQYSSARRQNNNLCEFLFVNHKSGKGTLPRSLLLFLMNKMLKCIQSSWVNTINRALRKINCRWQRKSTKSLLKMIKALKNACQVKV